MSCLFVNACFREGSRTARLAQRVLATVEGEVTRLDLAEADIRPLGAAELKLYNACVAARDYSDSLFDVAKQFADADEIVIAAPFWNYSVPALLHDYLELVCSQGVTFDIDEQGVYHSLCRAKRLVYVTTAGGPLPDDGNDHAFGYVRTLCEKFWFIPEVVLVKADCLDVAGADVDGIIAAAELPL